MTKQTVTFRLDIDLRKWQMDHFRKGVRQANARNFASSKEVKVALSRWRKP